jgi:hypothetical protein
MRLDPNGFSQSSVQPILHYITFTLPNSSTPFACVGFKLPERFPAFDMSHLA